MTLSGPEVAALTPGDRLTSRMEIYFGDGDAGVLAGKVALDDARAVLTGTLRVQAGEAVDIEADRLAFVALFLFCRWLEGPGDHEDPDCQTAFRLYSVLLTEVTGRPEHRRGSVEEFAAAARQATAPVLVRIHAAGEWATQAVALADPEAAADAYAWAVDLLPRLAWVGLDRRDQERALGAWNAIASDAAAAALCTRHPDRKNRAVELGEQGRSLLWEQQLGLRHDHRELTRRHPRLSARLHRVRQELIAAQSTALTRAGGI